MDSDELYKYLGFFFIILVLIYIVVRTMKFQVKVLEGFGLKDVNTDSLSKAVSSTDKDKVPEAIRSNTNMVSDALLVDKYLKAYEDTILELDSNIDTFILSQVLQNAESISSDPSSIQSQSIMTRINTAKSFSDSLNHAIKVLDKK